MRCHNAVIHHPKHIHLPLMATNKENKIDSPCRILMIFPFSEFHITFQHHLFVHGEVHLYLPTAIIARPKKSCFLLSGPSLFTNILLHVLRLFSKWNIFLYFFFATKKKKMKYFFKTAILTKKLFSFWEFLQFPKSF